MASYGYTFNSGDGVTPTRLNAARTVSEIVNADIASAAAIDKTKIAGTAITAADTGTVTSAMIADGAIVNADINASAAIAGTKIAPNFGSQNITTTGNIGINAANPSQRLVVTGSATVSSQANVAAKIGANTDSDLLLGSFNGNTPFVASQGAFPLAFHTNAVERMRIDAIGNVGIGTSSPATSLHVRGTASFGIISVASTSANSEASIAFFDSTDANADKWVIGKNINLTSDALCFYRDGNRMVITSSGDVGIATPTPASKLDINGNISISGTQAVTSRRTGWAAPTGTATRTTFATSTVTTAQLAERVKALIDDLTTHGLIGA